MISTMKKIVVDSIKKVLRKSSSKQIYDSTILKKVNKNCLILVQSINVYLVHSCSTCIS